MNYTILLRSRALHQAYQIAFTFLLDEQEEVRLTYQELNRQARTIGGLLQSLEVSGERVLLLYPSRLKFITAFFGCLYAESVAVPAYPPRRNQHMNRLQAVIADAQTKVLLTTTSILSNLQQRLAAAPDLETFHWLATNNIAEFWQEARLSSDTLQ